MGNNPQENSGPGIDIVAWNIKGGLGDAERAQGIIAWLAERQPTVAVLTEAYSARNPGELDEAVAALSGLGYAVKHVAQEVPQEGSKVPKVRLDAHGMVMIAKREQVRWMDLSVVKLAGRNALLAAMRDPVSGRAYDVFGQAGNDLDEEHRLADIAVLGRNIPRTADGDFMWPTVVATPANTMQRRGLMPRLLHTARPFVRRLPSASPDPDSPPAGLRGIFKRYTSVAQRLSGMAIGKAYKAYESLGLRNTDPRMEPTMREHGIPVKTTHVFVGPEFEVDAHEVHALAAANDVKTPVVPLSHRAVRAAVHLPEAA